MFAALIVSFVINEFTTRTRGLVVTAFASYSLDLGFDSLV